MRARLGQLGEDHRRIVRQGLVHRRRGADQSIDLLPRHPRIGERRPHRRRPELRSGLLRRRVAFRDTRDSLTLTRRETESGVEVRRRQLRLRHGDAGASDAERELRLHSICNRGSDPPST